MYQQSSCRFTLTAVLVCTAAAAWADLPDVGCDLQQLQIGVDTVQDGAGSPEVLRAKAPDDPPAESGASVQLNSAADMGSPVLKVILLAVVMLLPCAAFAVESWLSWKGAQRATDSPTKRRRSSSKDTAQRASQPSQPQDGGSEAAGGGSADDSPSKKAVMRRVTWAGPRTNTVVEEEEQGAFDLGGMFATLYAMPTESSNLRNLVSGGVVSVACIPGAISFSMIAGVSPLNGIWAGVFMGLYGSLLGGRPGMISCSSAATAVVLREIQVDHGVGAMGLAVVICGCLEVLAGALSLSRFIALVPHPVMLGFVNGLAIVIIRAQSQQFRQGMGGPLVEHDMLIGMIITAVVCMAGASLFPRIPRVGHLLPGPLVGIVLAIVAGQILSPWFPTRTLIDVAGQQTFAGGLASIPNWDFPPQQVKWGDSAMWGAVVITAVRMMLVGLVETLLTVKLIDQITGVDGCTRRECFGQGFGNIASGMFGTQGGCALIGESMINIGGGGHGRLSSFVMACGLATSVLLLAPVVGHIPVAALVGLMFLVALNTFAWGSFGILHIVDRLDLMVILTVTVVTILLDLASATIVGLFLSALGFAWSAAKDVRVDEETYEASTRTFVLKGALFFGSAMNFNNLIQPKCIPESHVVLDFSKGKILDHSGQEAIVKSIARLKEAGKVVKCAGLRGDAFSYVEYYHEDVLESQAAK